MAISFATLLKGLLIRNEADKTKQVIIQSSSASTTNTSTTITTAQTANRVLTLPDATDTLVGVSAAQTFTNKTIDATLNTILNIPGVSPNSVTNVYLAQMPADTIKGNNTGSTANAADLTVSQAQALLVIPTSSSPLAVNAGGTGASTANAGFNALSPMTTLGDTTYEDATPKAVRLAGNITATKKFLNQTGTGSISAAPTWGTIANTDLSGITNTQLSGSAAIANANLASMTNNTVKSNISGGSATPVDNTISDILDSSIANTQGDILYRSVAHWVALAPGTNGQVLTTGGASANPTWTSIDSNVTFVTTTYPVVTTDGLILCSGSAFTVTLFTAIGNSGKYLRIKKTDASLTNIITIATTGGQNIDGVSSTTLNTQNECVTLVSDGANWQIIERSVPSVWASYTPTYVGFGTVSAMNVYWRRSGQNIQILGGFTSGTTTGATASISIPSGLTTSTTILAAWAGSTVLYNAGSLLCDQVNQLAKVVLIGQNTTVMNFSLVDSSTQQTLHAQTGTVAIPSASNFSFNSVVIPIDGWN